MLACLLGSAVVLRAQPLNLLLLCVTSWRASQFHSVLLNFSILQLVISSQLEPHETIRKIGTKMGLILLGGTQPILSTTAK